MPVMNSLTFIAKHPTISLVQSGTTLRELKHIHTQLLQLTDILNNPHFHGQFVATIALENPTNLDYSIQLLVREVGLSVHGAIIKYGFENDPHVQNLVSKTAMVKACVECGNIDFARQLFDEMPERDTVAWNVRIAGKRTFTLGLVEEGQKHFESMKNLYGIGPKLEHYGLMVNLYGRVGRLEEAINFINKMPMEPHAGAWIACLMHVECTITDNWVSLL
ncbi:hypothetical protein K1719_002706 [Acacia pycnantha]|nr:hypothetical protein K1719_002706 [Acacia pycnantha]